MTYAMPSGWRRLAPGLALCAGLWGAAACSSAARSPFTVTERAITVENQSHDAWDNVEVWLNDHYRVIKPRMAPGERFDIPLNTFVAGFGQRFNPGRQIVKGIEVTATTGSGQAVRLVWGEGRRR